MKIADSTINRIGVLVAIIALGFTAYNALGARADKQVPSAPSISTQNTGPTQIVTGEQAKVTQSGDIVEKKYIYGAPPKASDPGGTVKTASVAICKKWVPVYTPALKAGDRILITATGTVQWGFKGQTSGPEGTVFHSNPLKGVFYKKCPVDDRNHVGALVGRFGGGKPFIIGAQKALIVQNGGLSLAVNDGVLWNNELGFNVRIERLS